MWITVKLYAILRQYFAEASPGQGQVVEAPEGSTGRDVIRRMGVPDDVPLVAMVNGTVQPLQHVLQDGDTLHVFPPVVGG